MLRVSLMRSLPLPMRNIFTKNAAGAEGPFTKNELPFWIEEFLPIGEYKDKSCKCQFLAVIETSESKNLQLQLTFSNSPVQQHPNPQNQSKPSTSNNPESNSLPWSKASLPSRRLLRLPASRHHPRSKKRLPHPPVGRGGVKVGGSKAPGV